MIAAGASVYCDMVESVSSGYSSVEEDVTKIFVAMADISRSPAR